MRIVPLVTQESQILEAEALCREAGWLLALRPYQHRKTGVIITGSEIYSGRIRDRFAPVVRKKLAAYPAEILGITVAQIPSGIGLDQIPHRLDIQFPEGLGGFISDPPYGRHRIR